MLTIDQIKGKNVLIRADLDVPVHEGKVENNYRLQAILPTIAFSLKYARRTCLIGHRGRPNGPSGEYSLIPVKNELELLLNQSISFISSGFSPGDCWTGESPISMVENLRFSKLEEELDRGFAKDLSKNADWYIYEAFATYRPCASLSLIPEYLPTSTGFRFESEIAELNNLLKSPEHPTLLLASGAKTDKLETIKSISPLFDQTILGGKFADSIDLTEDGKDINENYINRINQAIQKSKTIVVNGPVGMYESRDHSHGTASILQSLKEAQAKTILGGGDTLAAIPYLGFSYTDYGYVSTGGGAMLDFLEKKTHPLLKILENAKLN